MVEELLENFKNQMDDKYFSDITKLRIIKSYVSNCNNVVLEYEKQYSNDNFIRLYNLYKKLVSYGGVDIIEEMRYYDISNEDIKDENKWYIYKDRLYHCHMDLLRYNKIVLERILQDIVKTYINNTWKVEYISYTIINIYSFEINMIIYKKYKLLITFTKDPPLNFVISEKISFKLLNSIKDINSSFYVIAVYESGHDVNNAEIRYSIPNSVIDLSVYNRSVKLAKILTDEI